MSPKNKILLASLIAALLLIGLAVGLLMWRPQNNKPAAPVGVVNNIVTNDDKSRVTKFINPAVVLNLNKHFIINFQPLKDEIDKIQKKYPQKMFVYFDYLNNASSIGSSSTVMFKAASTVKVPLAMSVDKLIESGQLNASDAYTLDQLDLSSGFGDLYKVGADKTFAIGELMKIMLENSDNTAADALLRVLKLKGISDPLASVYSYMGWDTYDNYNSFSDMNSAPSYVDINLKTLSNMFISLYNATYVNPSNSAKILEYLDNSPFNSQIVAGVPEDIPVSHKIGVLADDKVYCDCGIVYVPNRDYILCLGSVGADEATANKFMKEVSAAAYQFVSSN